jgi:hypothetical protein
MQGVPLINNDDWDGAIWEAHRRKGESSGDCLDVIRISPEWVEKKKLIENPLVSRGRYIALELDTVRITRLDRR